jgi:hypothetical protein
VKKNFKDWLWIAAVLAMLLYLLFESRQRTQKLEKQIKKISYGVYIIKTSYHV